MQSKILAKQTLLLAIISSGLAFFVAFLLNVTPKNLAQDESLLPAQDEPSLFINNAVALLSQERSNVALPVRLKIPSIYIDAPIEYVGITPDGAMDAPKGPVGVAWFNLGPRPGENGSSVIAGHYGWKNNTPAVFDNLHELNKGDKISVEDERGVTTTFAVREIRTYNKDEAAPDVFVSYDDKAHLNLITCAGVWNKSEKKFSERLVVFADKVSEVRSLSPFRPLSVGVQLSLAPSRAPLRGTTIDFDEL